MSFKNVSLMSFHSLQTGTRITRVEATGISLLYMSFHSLQMGKRITSFMPNLYKPLHALA